MNTTSKNNLARCIGSCLDMYELPVDPHNSFGFDPSKYNAETISKKFHDTLGWIFWVTSSVIREHGTFEHIRHVRHLMLSGVSMRNAKTAELKTSSRDYTVEVATANNIVAIIFEELSKDHCGFKRTYYHLLNEDSIPKEHIYKAILCNRNLKEDIAQGIRSPFGPKDIVFPPSIRPKFHKGDRKNLSKYMEYRTLCFEEIAEENVAFEQSKKRLNNCDTISQIQIMFSDLPLMDNRTFNTFVHLAAAKVHQMTKAQNS